MVWAVVKVWLFILVAIEFVALYRVSNGDAVAEVQQMYSLIPKKYQPDNLHFLFLCTTLALLRLNALLSDNLAAWRINAWVHSLEAVLYYFLIIIAGKNKFAPVELDLANVKTQGMLVFGGVIFNAFLFNTCWLMSGSEPSATTVTVAPPAAPAKAASTKPKAS